MRDGSGSSRRRAMCDRGQHPVVVDSVVIVNGNAGFRPRVYTASRASDDRVLM